MPQTDSTTQEDRWLGADELRRIADPQADPLPAAASEPEPSGREMPVAGTALALLALLVIALLIVL